MTPAGNLKHQAAVAATSEQVLVLRSDIREQLTVLVGLVAKLEYLADTRQSVGLGFLTAEGKELANKQTRTDRAAARGQHRARGVGLKFLNSAAVLGTGQVEAPVTMTAVSASAAVLFTMQHQINRLTKTALLVVLEHEQTEQEDQGRCTWPRNTLTAVPPTSDGDVDKLAGHLARLVDVYSNRPGLAAMLRDLQRAEADAREVIDGPAKTNHPEPCPWCGRHSLAVHHRDLGRAEMFIRCDGTHRCVCDDETCDCHRNPTRNRHEWVNSGRAKNTVSGRSPHALTTLIDRRKETTRMEALALDAITTIRAMHQPFWIDADGDSHTFYVLVAGTDLEQLAPDHTCIDLGHDACDVVADDPASSLHSVPGCVECQTRTDVDGQPGHRVWPCETYSATQLDTVNQHPAHS